MLDVKWRPGRSRVAPSDLTTWPDDGVYQGRRTFIPILFETILGVAKSVRVLFRKPGNIRRPNAVYSMHIAQYSRNTKESEIDKSNVIVISLAALASSSAFSQSKTRAEVYHELIEAQQSGLNYATETSYPEVNPIYAAQVTRNKHLETLGVSP
ncbi:DUF4148 domain-containing protein [Paraburkholderia elongata]|nr:DUF4148 domain-containing protein [Paraburkholderia elongata]